MGRMYSATFAAVAVTADQDLFEIVAPADAVVAIHGWGVSQSSDVGDAAEECANLVLRTGMTTSGSGGGAFTPIPRSLGDAAFGGTCEINNTTPASTGTIVNHDARAVNLRVGADVWYPPEARVIVSPSARACLTAASFTAGTDPADSLTMSGWIVFEEIGG